ncbi:MAG TPA: [Fe-Fe] hydrogenase large subunit C-terminal domain-containing protein [Phycisphaerae bacterium]|nr:[Fe-Fe] hydrogenase large subunit C-terminal domain-containing protein [Phycisphaerae bacterium]
MPESTHGFKIDQQQCRGCLACMRSCPTQAIRVKYGKAELLPRLCIDCGSCLKACGSGAIQATTRSFAEIGKFRFKVAVPSPVLFGQFPLGVSPAHVVAGLQSLGFDAVWNFAVELAVVNRAIAEYVETWKGPHPLLSVSCPVIVRLVQVLYPNMVDQLIRIQPPRELAGQELKRKYSEQLGIDRDDIAAIYITPCQAKTISILAPAEDAKSNLEGALGISDVYNDILSATRLLKHAKTSRSWKDLLWSADMLRWPMGVGQGRRLSRHRYMSVTGLANVIQVFDDIEKGKLRNIEYLECYACWGGCIGGNLTVDNIYVTLSKIHRLLAELPDTNPMLEAEAEQRYRRADFALKGRITPRNTQPEPGDLKQRVQRMKSGEAVTRALPGLDCGLCGAPTCETLAKDVAEGSARQDDCVFFSDERLRRLRQTYLRNG